MKPCSSTQETIQTRRERGNFGLVSVTTTAGMCCSRGIPRSCGTADPAVAQPAARRRHPRTGRTRQNRQPRAAATGPRRRVAPPGAAASRGRARAAAAGYEASCETKVRADRCARRWSPAGWQAHRYHHPLWLRCMRRAHRTARHARPVRARSLGEEWVTCGALGDGLAQPTHRRVRPEQFRDQCRRLRIAQRPKGYRLSTMHPRQRPLILGAVGDQNH